MRQTLIYKMLAAVAISVTLLWGCGGGGSSSGTGSGTLNLGITDAPVDSADAVVIAITGVEIKPTNGSSTMYTYNAPKVLDLMTLTGGASDTLLVDETVPAGGYAWVRLYLDLRPQWSYIEIDGVQYELDCPSCPNTGLKINNPFTMPDGGVLNFMIDFDLRKSVHLPNNGSNIYKLRPTLRLVNNDVVGTVSGDVDATLLSANPGCIDGISGEVKAVIYVFTGTGATPDDVDGIEPDPITSFTVQDDGDGTYSYAGAFIEPGGYTLSMTCDAMADDPATDDDATVSFLLSYDVNVVSNTNTVQDF